MSHWAQGPYTVINRAEYVGRGEPRYRSGWELSFMKFCDTNENVLQWASESIAIPYRHPLTGKMTQYVPDFLITYRTRNNTVRAELIEIKPKKQTIPPPKPQRQTKGYVREVYEYARNQSKWEAAREWCADRGYEFKVITENELGIQ